MLEAAVLGSCEAFKNSCYSICKIKAVGSAEVTASTITAMVWWAHGNMRGVAGSQGVPALTAYCISIGVSTLTTWGWSSAHSQRTMGDGREVL